MTNAVTENERRFHESGSGISGSAWKAKGKLRVLQVIPHLYPAGAERVVVNLARHIRSSDFEVAVVTLYGRTGTALETILDKTDTPAWYLGKRLGFDFRCFRKFDEVLRTFRPHVVHTHLGALRYTLPVSSIRRIPVLVHTAHNRADKETDRIGRWVRRMAFKLGVVPISISREVQQTVFALYRVSESPLIPNGIPTQEFARDDQRRAEWRDAEGYERDDFLYVTVGRLTDQKNHALMLEAFADGPARDPRSKLILVGDGELRDALHGQVQSQGLTKQVCMLGIRNDIPDILNAADLFVISSKYEGHPLCVMEAMAAGLPVLSTTFAGADEMVEHGQTGWLVAQGDPAAMASAMLRAREAPELLREMGNTGSARARSRFDVEAMSRAYENLYMTRLQKSRSGTFVS